MVPLSVGCIPGEPEVQSENPSYWAFSSCFLSLRFADRSLLQHRSQQAQHVWGLGQEHPLSYLKISGNHSLWFLFTVRMQHHYSCAF